MAVGLGHATVRFWTCGTRADSAMSDDALPTVSVVLPALNEGEYIEGCLASLLAQDYPAVTEILVVDGGSTDGTVALAEAFGPPVRVVPNPRVTAAAALNIGISEAAGELICRADAHAEYAHDYIRRCVEVLLETGADNVGGPVRAVGRTPFGRAVAAVFSSPLGTGPAPSHYATDRRDGDTVWLGCWRRETLEALGGFDEDRLQWAAEDQELNFRIRRRGGRIVLDPSIRVTYFPPRLPGRSGTSTSTGAWLRRRPWSSTAPSQHSGRSPRPCWSWPPPPAWSRVGPGAGGCWCRLCTRPSRGPRPSGSRRARMSTPPAFARPRDLPLVLRRRLLRRALSSGPRPVVRTRPHGHRQPAPRGAGVASAKDPRCTIAQ